MLSLNFVLQADLCGIKWKKLVLNERPLATGDPLDDPVLRSYTKCLAKDILCVWRRVSQHKNDLDQTGGLGMFDISQVGCPSVIHPPLSLTAAKELWIFWYGEEPDLTDLVSPELLKSPGKSSLRTELKFIATASKQQEELGNLFLLAFCFRFGRTRFLGERLVLWMQIAAVQSFTQSNRTVRRHQLFDSIFD